MIVAILNILTISAIIALIFYPANLLNRIKDHSLIFSYIIFIISLGLLDSPINQAYFFESFNKNIIFFPNFVLNFSYAVDGLSVFFILLTTFLTVILCLTSRSISYRVKEKYILLFILEFLLINCFTSTEIFFFYIFFETILIPMYILIGVWGSQKNKIFAANQFFLYTLFGSFFLLIAITLTYSIFGSSNIFILKSFLIENNLENLMFLLFFVSFSVKVPMFPFHLWLPKAHVEAPTVGSVLLAGVLLKLGSYGFLRYSLFLFPNASLYFAPIIIAICVISVVFSSLTTMRQIDLKRIIAYSSVAHMNYLIAGLFSNSC